MKCQRCLRGEEARYCAYTDAMEIKACPSCAEEARRLGIVVIALDLWDGRNVEVSGVKEMHHSPINPESI